mmetsp:Transcript_49424/g.137361  ORF Transcript_49424/g.137361 Transcript_49424/m.137361 type:complete len:225 (-) Transcript_49424:634-1308(-)
MGREGADHQHDHHRSLCDGCRFGLGSHPCRGQGLPCAAGFAHSYRMLCPFAEGHLATAHPGGCGRGADLPRRLEHYAILGLPTCRSQLARPPNVVQGHLHRRALCYRGPVGELDDGGAHRPNYRQQRLHEARMLRPGCWQHPRFPFRHPRRLRTHCAVPSECWQRWTQPCLQPGHGCHSGLECLRACACHGPDPCCGARRPHHTNRTEHLCVELPHASPARELD